jgi:hypothetical protein
MYSTSECKVGVKLRLRERFGPWAHPANANAIRSKSRWTSNFAKVSGGELEALMQADVVWLRQT